MDQQIQTQIKENLDSANKLVQNNPNHSELSEIWKLTTQIDSYFSDFRKDYLDTVRKDPNAKEIMFYDSYNGESFLYGVNKSGEGYILERKLKQYINSLNDLSPSFSFQHIARNAKDIKSFKGTTSEKLDFVELSFGNAPAIANLTTLSEYQRQVSHIQLQAMQKLISEQR